jgi:hypothetical protein
MVNCCDINNGGDEEGFANTRIKQFAGVGFLGAWLLEFFGCVNGEVSQYAICARAFESKQTFHHHFIVIEPTVLRSGFEHGVFTRDLVGKGGHLEFVFDATHYI